MALTLKKVERATEPGRYGDGFGLYLEVRSARNRQWVFRYERVLRTDAGHTVLKPSGRPKTREHWLSLGPAHTYDLEEARDIARAIRKQLREGEDPAAKLADERSARSRNTTLAPAPNPLSFRQAAEAFFGSKSAQWKNKKHREQFTATMETYVYPLIGRTPVTEIDTPMVLSVLNQEMSLGGGKSERFWLARPETASRVRRRLEWVLAWATVSEHRIGDNPARWRGHLDHVLPARGDVARTRHHPALPYVDLPSFMHALRARTSVSARALEFCVLTAARTGEVIGATWDEIDLEAKIWSVPAERLKAGKFKRGQPHRVPLSADAVSLLKALPREGTYVFTGAQPGRPLSNMAMKMVLDRMNKPSATWVDRHGEPAVPHGFRSTFRDWAAAETRHQREAIELALSHVPGAATEMAYWRDDMLLKRASLMGDWAAFCAAGPRPDAGAADSRGLEAA